MLHTFLVNWGPVSDPTVDPTRRIAFVRTFFVCPNREVNFWWVQVYKRGIPAVFAATILKLRM